MQNRGKYEIERKRKKERDEGKWWKHWVCARAVSEHETVTMVRLGTDYKEYGTIGSTLQSVRFEPPPPAIHFMKVTAKYFRCTFFDSPIQYYVEFSMWVCLIAISSSVAYGLPIYPFVRCFMLGLVSPFSILCFVLYVFHALCTL